MTSQLLWQSVDGISFYIDDQSHILMSAHDIANFISFHLQKEINFSSISNIAKNALSREEINPPVTYINAPSKFGNRDVNLYDERTCCYFIRKLCSQHQLTLDLMEVSFNIYVNSLFVTLLTRTPEGKKKLREFTSLIKGQQNNVLSTLSSKW